MAGFGREQITHNAYRILGLSATATQAQIDAAARLLRLWGDSGGAPAAEASWLGPLPQGLMHVEHAASRLAHPETRIEERLWWFHGQAGAAVVRGSAVAQHAEALALLFRLTGAPDIWLRLNQWKTVLDLFSQLSVSAEFAELLNSAESRGDFEKRAHAAEIEAAQASMAARVAGVLVEAAENAIADADRVLVGDILEMFSGLACCEGPRRELLGRLEDALARECREATADVEAAWERMQIDPLKRAAGESLQRYSKVIEPLLALLLKHGQPGDGDSQDRLKGPIVQLLVYTARAYGGCYDYVAAETVLEKAAALARGTPMRATVENQLEQIRPKAAAQRAKLAAAVAPPPPQYSPPVGLPRRTQRTYASHERPASTSNKRVLTPLLALLFMGVISAFIGIIANQSRQPVEDRAYEKPVIPLPAPEQFNFPVPPKADRGSIVPDLKTKSAEPPIPGDTIIPRTMALDPLDDVVPTTTPPGFFDTKSQPVGDLTLPNSQPLPTTKYPAVPTTFPVNPQP